MLIFIFPINAEYFCDVPTPCSKFFVLWEVSTLQLLAHCLVLDGYWNNLYLNKYSGNVRTIILNIVCVCARVCVCVHVCVCMCMHVCV